MLIKFIRQSWLVITAALSFGLLVAVVHGALEQKIADNASEKLSNQMRILLADAQTFEDVKGQDHEVLYSIGRGADGNIVGYAIIAEGSGFADKIKLLVTMDADLKKLLGIAVLKSNETPGFGDAIKGKFKEQYKDCPIDKELIVEQTGKPEQVDEKIIAITGATISSEVVTDIVNDAIDKMRKY